ncbi:nuclear RNA export factor 1 [Pelodytes ibericus]
MADGGRLYNEHDDRFFGSSNKRRKGRGPFRAKMFGDGSQKYQGGGYGANPRSRLDTEEANIAYDAPQSRFTPYIRGGRRRDDRPGNMKGKYRGPAHSDIPPQNKLDTNDNQKAWHKITIPHGKKYEKAWLIGILQNACDLPFNPVEYHCDHSRAHFFVDDTATAKALKRISRKCTDKNNFKITVLTRLGAPPRLSNSMKDEDAEHFKTCMQKRYEGSLQALDMKALRSDPDLIANKIDLVLSRPIYMEAMLHIIEDNVPELLSLDISNNKLYRLDDMAEIHNKAPNLKGLNLSNNMLKTERELDKIKNLKLEELWLDGNPLCDNFRDQTAYISAVRERFPKLLRLDGHDLPPPITFDVETPTTLPPCKGSYLGNEEIKVVVLRFLQQYYACYDAEDRQSLLNVYHDEACCSLALEAGQNPSRNSSLGEYFKDSRNVKKIKDPNVRYKLIKHKRLSVVGFLNELPRTQHDLNSFVVDINAYSNTMLSFVLNGVFKEVDGQSSDPVRAFSRVFVAVPGSDGGLLLVNDEQFIRNATTEEIRKAFATPAPTPSSSPVPALAPVPHDMVQAFTVLSGMNVEWSQKCLQENDWDFDRASQIFMKLKAEGIIPEIAFSK